MFKKSLLKWPSNSDQYVYERKLKKVMEHLGVRDYSFNWNRHSCFIEFRYKENAYRLEHSIDKALKRGIILRNGMDCLKELIESLEDLNRIIKRGTNEFEVWISGMRQPTFDQEMPVFKEEIRTREARSEWDKYSEYDEEDEEDQEEEDQEEVIPFANDRLRGMIRRGLR